MATTTKSTRVTDPPAASVGRVVAALTGLSNKKVRGMFDHGCVTVNGAPCSQAGESVQAGDQVEVNYDPAQGYPEKKRAWEDASFSIVFEDPHMVVVNKAANVLTVATDRGGERNTLVDRVSHYLKHTGRRREALVVHRLDRGVSGLLVFAKSQRMLEALQDQFKQRKPDRRYIAIVAGILERESGTYRSHLATGKALNQYSTRDESQRRAGDHALSPAAAARGHDGRRGAARNGAAEPDSRALCRSWSSGPRRSAVRPFEVAPRSLARQPHRAPRVVAGLRASGDRQAAAVRVGAAQIDAAVHRRASVEEPMTLELIATAASGTEAVVKRELAALGYEARTVTPGRLLFSGDESAIAGRISGCGPGERVLIQMGSFPATDFGVLFDGVAALPWEQWLPRDAEFPVQGRSHRSQLSSVPACQRIVKRAIVKRLQEAHHAEELPETGPLCSIEISLRDDVATLTLDTTGVGLHKRGYRRLVGEAQLRETLAAVLVQLSFWRPGRVLADPFCGTGTIPIEAALIGRNIAPGLKREFAAEAWPTFDGESLAAGARGSPRSRAAAARGAAAWVTTSIRKR